MKVLSAESAASKNKAIKEFEVVCAGVEKDLAKRQGGKVTDIADELG